MQRRRTNSFRPRPCHCFIGWAAVAALAAAGETVAQTDPPTTVLVEEYAQFVTLVDTDADGIITDVDFVSWLVQYVDDIPISDVDGNGVIDCDDAVLTLAAVLDGLAGNLASDAIIDSADVIALVQKMMEPPPPEGVTAKDGDLNADGLVNEQDLAAVLAVIGQTKELSSEMVALTILENVTTSSCYAVKHSTYFSSTWPDGRPPWAPPDHHYTFSQTWPPERRPETPPPGTKPPWPPNHHADFSNTWPITDWPVGHIIAATLMERPGEHGTNFSRQWPPNHVFLITSEWLTPLPGTTWPPHSIDTSRKWPPNHRLTESNTTGPHHEPTSWFVPVPSPHLDQVSRTEHPAHDETRSASWPPNHYTHVTNGWPNTHSMSASAYWPPNHFTTPSTTWPGDIDTTWPPNHYAQLSAELQRPGTPTPFFPPGHSYWTTFRELIPLLP